MKKITFLIMFLIAATGFAQDSTLPFDMEDSTNPFVVFDCDSGNCPSGTNIANPDMSGINTSGRVYEYVRNVGVAWYSGFVFDSGLRSTPLINISSDGKIFRLKIWSTKAPIDVRFQLEQGSPDVGASPSYDVIQTLNTPNTWVEMTFDFTSTPVADGMAYNSISIFPDWNPGNQSVEDEMDTYYFDDIEAVGAAPPTCDDGIQNGMETGVDCGGPDCPECPPTCDDGIQNGMETGVDCGGPDCPDCPAPDPTSAPTESGSTGSDMYVYSGLSGNANQSDFPTFTLYSFGGSVIISEPEFSGNKVLKIENLDFYGQAFSDPVSNFNITGTYSFVHLDYYATTSTAFNFSLVDDSLSQTVCCGNPAEPFFRFGAGQDQELITGEWVSVFIPLSHFSDFNPDWDGTDLKQTLFTGNGTVYIDNIYFSTTNTLGTSEFSISEFNIFPNPTQNVWNVKANNQNIDAFTLFDIQGREVINLTPNATETVIDASTLPAGLYFAKINTASGTKSIKLIKQ